MGWFVTGGGSLVLASLIDQAGEALYQDFRSEYGLNFKEFVATHPPYETLMLIRGLTLGSRFVSQLQGGEQFQQWNTLAYQMATLIDAVNYVTYAVVAANSQKRKPKQPKPSYRPSKNTRKSTNMFRTQLDAAKNRKARGG